MTAKKKSLLYLNYTFSSFFSSGLWLIFNIRDFVVESALNWNEVYYDSILESAIEQNEVYWHFIWQRYNSSEQLISVDTWLMPCASVGKADIPWADDRVHSDQEGSSSHAYCPWTARSTRWWTAWKPVSGTGASSKISPLISPYYQYKWQILCLQCFDAVGWAAGRASGL